MDIPGGSPGRNITFDVSNIDRTTTSFCDDISLDISNSNCSRARLDFNFIGTTRHANAPAAAAAGDCSLNLPETQVAGGRAGFGCALEVAHGDAAPFGIEL